MPRRLTILRLVTHLLLGAALTWLIAVPLAVHAPAIGLASTASGSVARGVILHAAQHTPTLLYDSYTIRITRMDDSVIPGLERAAPWNVPAWLTVPAPATREDARTQYGLWSVETYAAGWPCRAFKGERWGRIDQRSAALRTFYETHGFFAWSWGSHNFLWPATLIWTGLIIDTLFWATLTGGGLGLLAHLKKRRRLRRGRCPACNYDRSGLAPGAPCPECGHTPPP